ncbi:diguanylate cyclase [Aliiglaciecola litoralis]|uniref:diguanylate cyclase n=1 Tax=Aliiglaciecola litoralis TaxID=582857 RepID=A0ABP3X3B5_9ALTE
MKVIVAEDDPVTQLLISETLKRWDYHVLVAKNGLEVLALLAEHGDVQLFLLDWQMPELDGIELCKKLKTSRGTSCCYIIMLTSKKATENIVQALDSGADDFISKPFSPEELKVRLKVGCRIIETENSLLHQAHHDGLTNTLNHRAIVDVLSQLWSRSVRDKSSLAVLMLDIDYFKRINDSYGHQVGDYALKHFCKLVKQELRPYDSLGRYGGEEFAVCLPSTEADEAMIVAQRIRTCVESHPVEYDGLNFTMTVSIGVSVFSENQQSYKELLLDADRAVYDAKSKGRNAVVFAK